MKIDKDNFSHLANMVRLNFSKKEEEQLSHDLNQTITFIDAMNQADTDNIEPMTFVHSRKNVFREDIINKEDSKGQVLTDDSDIRDGYYVVPKTIE